VGHGLALRRVELGEQALGGIRADLDGRRCRLLLELWGVVGGHPASIATGTVAPAG
jgi:hypothetical protein